MHVFLLIYGVHQRWENRNGKLLERGIRLNRRCRQRRSYIRLQTRRISRNRILKRNKIRRPSNRNKGKLHRRSGLYKSIHTSKRDPSKYRPIKLYRMDIRNRMDSNNRWSNTYNRKYCSTYYRYFWGEHLNKRLLQVCIENKKPNSRKYNTNHRKR